MNIRAFCIAVHLVVTVSMPSFAQSTSITNGLNWLSTNQNTDGSWGSNASTAVVDTTEVINAKMKFGNDASIQNATSWLTAQEVVTVDELSRKVSSSSYVGTDTSSLISALIDARNSENGWGYKAGYSNTPFDTGLALQALKSANYTDQAVIFSAIQYLLTIQNTDGGWGFVMDDESNVYVTAQVISALAQFTTTYLTGQQLSTAATYLLSKQNNQNNSQYGGFGEDSSSTVYETALAFIALIESGQTQGLPLQNAITYLTTTQLPNGSWNDDPYSTALALRALSFVKPDLSILPVNIAVLPAAPTLGNLLTITATVANIGLEAAGNVTIRLLDNGAPVSDQTIAAIAPGGTGQAVFTISPLTPTGEHNLTVTVDPLNTIDEISRTNNSATTRIWAKSPADLVVLPEYLTISPLYPKPGESITVTAKIANMGETAATAFFADLYDGDPNNGGTKLGSFPLPGIASGEWGSGSVVFNLAAEGVHALYLVVDQLHGATETSTDNNTTQKSINVSAIGTGFLNDLSIPMNGIQLNPQRPHSGDNVTVTLLAVNLGADTTTADLELFDGDPANGGILLHKSTVALSKGETRTVTVPWQIPAGIHTLRAYIDRAGAVIERDKTNNSQTLTVMADMVDIEVSASDISITPEHPMDGDPATVKVIVQNRGIVATGPFSVNLYNGDPNSGGTLLQTFPISNMAGDATQEISYSFTAARGTYRFYAVCDPDNQVAELHEDNNLAIRSLLVKTSAEAKGADLVPLEFDLSGTTTDPQSLSISGTATVKFQNKGDDKIVTPFRVTVFEDKDGDGNYTEDTDLALGSWDYSTPMNPNMVGIVSINLAGTVTFRAAPIYAMVDSRQMVYEQNEKNNTIRKGSACEARPSNPIEPVLKWQYPRTTDPSFGSIFARPVVISLTDTNGDGRIDNNDAPAILVNASNYNTSLDGKLWAFKGNTGDVIFSHYTVGQGPQASGQPIVGDIDGDEKPDILIKNRYAEGIVAYNNDGTVKWDNSSQVTAFRLATPGQQIHIHEGALPALADLDGDGHTEIIYGATVVNWDGSMRCSPVYPKAGGLGWTNGFSYTVSVADLDMDGKQEIIAGNTAYNSDCSIKWFNTSLPDGLTAIGNFDDDPYPEIVLMSSTGTGQALTGPRVYLLDHNGTVKWGPIYISQLDGAPNSGYSGLPIIADFDGDGKPEIGVRGMNKLFILDMDGRLKKTLSTPSGLGVNYLSAPTVFDLDGDGIPEVLISSGGNFMIFSGKDGSLLYQGPTGFASYADAQDITIVDLDGDGHSEAVLYGSNSTGGNLRVYGAKNNNWVGTRRIWNQPSYHVTNINDDGSIPQYEAPSWLTNNNYRCNVPTTIGPSPYLAADLSVSYVRVDMANFPGSVTITARIGNGGAKVVSQGLITSFHNGDPANGGVLLGTAVTSKSLNPGDYEDVSFVWTSPTEGNHTIYVKTGSDAISECDLTNNTLAYPVFITSILPDLALNLQLNPQRPRIGDIVTVSILARNTGNAAATANLELFDGDPDTSSIALYASVVTLNGGESKTITVPWQIPSGIHTLRAYIDRAGAVAERDETNNSQTFTVMADMVDIEVSASDISITPEYPMDGDPTTVKVVIQNRGIAATGAFSVNLYNGDPNSGGTLLQTFAISNMVSDATQEISYPFTAARGTYRFYAVCDPDNQVAELHEDNNLAIRSLLVKTSAEAKGPDLVPLEFDLSGSTTDTQSLRISGTAKVKFQNKGDDKIATPFRITIFEDKDGDGIYTEGTDLALGYWDYAIAMNPNMVGVVSINLAGTVTFRDAPIYAMLDSGQVVFEQNKGNNTIRRGSVCENRPAKTIEPVVKWRWKGDGAVTMPLVISLTDDNGDGRIDNKDNPAILFSKITNYYTVSLVALRGGDGSEVFTTSGPDIYAMNNASYAAVGDINGDGKPEILVPRNDAGLVAYKHDGTVLWNNKPLVIEFEKQPWSTTSVRLGATPIIADLDGDGVPEIVMGATVLNADGSVRWLAKDRMYGSGIGQGQPAISSNVADLNLDGKQEVVAGNAAYNTDGTTFWWNKSLTDGNTAVGNLDDDPYPEIVLNTTVNQYPLPTSARIYLLEHDGTIKWGPVYLKDLEGITIAFQGGAPMIADFDGDGEPEIGIKGMNKYYILDKNGNVKQTLAVPYNTVTGDTGGYFSSPTVFDLNGDGHPEVMFNSDGFFRVFDGKLGTLLFEEKFGASGVFQNVLVADVSGNGHADIVVAGSDRVGANASGDGVRVYGAKNNDWVGTRRIWNQPSYHVTNVNDDGSIPKNEAPSWLLNNNYRCQVPTSTGPNPYLASDLSASFVRVDMANFPAFVSITVRIGNGGAKQVADGIRTAFYDGDPANGGVLIGFVLTTKTLNFGEYEDITLVWNIPAEGNHTIRVKTDADNTQSECDKANNSVTLPVYIASGKSDLSIVAADIIAPATIPEGSLTNILVTVRNIGTLQADNVLVRLYVGNPALGGKLIGTDQIVPTITAGGAATIRFTWNTMGTAGVSYLYAVVDVAATTLDANPGNNTANRQVLVAAAVKSDLQIGAADITITPSSPQEGDTMTVSAIIHNLGSQTGNFKVALYDGIPASGGLKRSETIIPQMIGQGGSATATFTLDTIGLSGNHAMYVRIDPDNVIDESDKTNNQTSRSVTVAAIGLPVSIATDKSAYSANENVQAAVSLAELNGTAHTLTYDLQVLDAQGILTASLPETALSLSAKASLNFIIPWNTAATYAGSYTLMVRIKENNRIIGKAMAAITILPVKTVDTRIVVDKSAYRANEQAAIIATVIGNSPNYIFNDLSAKTSVLDANGQVLFTTTRTIPSLGNGQRVELKNYWNTGTHVPGTYSAVIEVTEAGTLIETATQNIVISSAVAPSALLKGTVTVNRQSLLSGETVNVSCNLINQGNKDLPNVSLSVLTVHVVNQTVYNTLTYQTALLMGATYTASGQIDTTDFTAKDYLVILRANIGGVEETIASSYFRVEGAPSAPALSGPGIGTDVETLTPMFSVSNAADPNDDKLTYEFEIYSDSSLINRIVVSDSVASGQTGTTSWNMSLPLTENLTYYWRARAFDGHLYGHWMATATFRVNMVNDLPSAPTVSNPVDGSSVALLVPTLTVNNASDPDSPSLTYNFDVALDPAFTQIVASTKGVTGGQGATSWQVSLPLAENNWFYWRAQADDWLTEGPWSTTARFFVNTINDAPTVPQVTSPANGVTVASLATDVVVTNSTDPDSMLISYFFEVDAVPTFDSPDIIRSGSIAEQQTSTSWHVVGLKDNTQYYVRVKASDGTTDSSWSQVFSFFANTINDPPTTPVLTNPSNGAGVNLFTPTLAIQNSTDPDRDVLTYDFELYGDATLANLVTKASGVPETPQISAWTVPVSLTENQTYYWRARASDGTLQSGWMPAAAFVVNTANDAPGAPQLSLPIDGISLATLTPTLTVMNAVDPDSASLTYDFEVYNNAALVDAITGVSEGAGGLTSVTLKKTLIDNTNYSWRARAFDGDRYSSWMNMAAFTTHIAQANITAEIEFEPQTLNKKSTGTWVKVEIELPHGFKVADIDISSIRLEGKVPVEPHPISIHCKGDGDELTVKFRRSDVIAVLPIGNQVPVHVSGKVGTTTFEGIDIIRVID